MRAASTSRVSKPGFTLLSLMKLRTSRPAATSSTRARVTSPTTRVLWRRRRPPVAPGSRAERAPDRHLPASRGSTSQQQVGRVGAGDQEHQADGAQQNDERPAHIADPRVPEQADVKTGVEDRAQPGGGGGGAAARA